MRLECGRLTFQELHVAASSYSTLPQRQKLTLKHNAQFKKQRQDKYHQQSGAGSLKKHTQMRPLLLFAHPTVLADASVLVKGVVRIDDRVTEARVDSVIQRCSKAPRVVVQLEEPLLWHTSHRLLIKASVWHA